MTALPVRRLAFRDGPIGRLDAAGPTGAYAGLLTTGRRAADVSAA